MQNKCSKIATYNKNYRFELIILFKGNKRTFFGIYSEI